MAAPRPFLNIPEDIEPKDVGHYLRLVLETLSKNIDSLDTRLRRDARFVDERRAKSLRVMEGEVGLDMARRGNDGDVLYLVNGGRQAVWGSASNPGPGGAVPVLYIPHALLDGVQDNDTLAHAPVLGDLIGGNATPLWARIAGQTTATRKFLRQTGTGTVSATPAWDTLVAGDIPTLTSAAGWQDVANVISEIVTTDKVVIGAAAALAATRFSVVNAGATTDVVQALKMIASQSADGWQLLRSDGKLLARFDNTGQLHLGYSQAAGLATINAILYVGGFDPASAGSGQTHGPIMWGDNTSAIGPAGSTADYVGMAGARFYTYKDPTGVFDNGYGQDNADAWVLVCDDSITYSFWSVLTAGGTPYLRAQWAGNGDLTNYGIVNIVKSKKAAGSLAASTPALRLWSTGSSSPTRYTGIQAAATVTSTHTLTLPAALPATTGIVRVDSTGAVTYDVTPALGSTKSGATITTNTTQAADIATANLLAAGHTAGMYRVSVVLEDTGADLTAGAVQVTVGWTDDVGATTANPTGGTGTFPLVLTATGRAAGHVVLYSTGAAAITYATSHTGIFGTATYALRVRTEFIG